MNDISGMRYVLIGTVAAGWFLLYVLLEQFGWNEWTVALQFGQEAPLGTLVIVLVIAVLTWPLGYLVHQIYLMFAWTGEQSTYKAMLRCMERPPAMSRLVSDAKQFEALWWRMVAEGQHPDKREMIILRVEKWRRDLQMIGAIIFATLSSAIAAGIHWSITGGSIVGFGWICAQVIVILILLVNYVQLRERIIVYRGSFMNYWMRRDPS